MIAHLDLYVDFITRQGVGARDVVASSPNAYVSYLKGASSLLGIDIAPHVLRSDEDVDGLVSTLWGRRSDNTVRNYRVAMRQYVKMVRAEGL